MEEEHAISALKRKRAQLAGQLIELDKQHRSIRHRISHIDGALRIFGYKGDPKDIPAKATQQPRLFQRGELRRMVRIAIREGHTQTGDIAQIIIAQMGWNVGDAELQSMITEKVKDVRKKLTARDAASSLSTGG